MNKRILLWLFLAVGIFIALWKLNTNRLQIKADAELSKIKPAHTPVEVAIPKMEALGAKLETDGIFLPAKEMWVISETQGRILEVFKNKGEWLNEGDVIAKVDDELLRIELEATQANLSKLRKDRERLGNLIEGEAAPKNKIEDVELGIQAAEAKEKALKKQISNTSIKAPMSGTMGIRIIERGSVIGPGIQVAQITNLEKLFLMVKVTERDILQIKKGLSVKVRPDVFAKTEIPAKVTNIGLKADNTFNYDVEIEVPNLKDNPLRGGMHAKGIFTFDKDRIGLTLPRKAVVGSLQEPKIYVVQDSTVSLRPVTLGASSGEKIEILSGITAQDKVVVAGQLNLSEGVKVDVVKVDE